MAENLLRKKRNVDVVFCIDGTGSMGDCIENVKNHARRFQADLVAELTEMGSDIDSLRVKVIVFRDYKDPTSLKDKMDITPFFELPADTAEYEEYLMGVSPFGGGDAPENGLEALYYAMKSDFVTGSNDRQVIVLFTDADALALGERAGCADYPTEMAADLNGLNEIWECCQNGSLRDRNKRLVLFAPAGTTYEGLKTTWNRSVFQAVDSGKGLEELDFSDIIKVIAASVAG